MARSTPGAGGHTKRRRRGRSNGQWKTGLRNAVWELRKSAEKVNALRRERQIRSNKGERKKKRRRDRLKDRIRKKEGGRNAL